MSETFRSVIDAAKFKADLSVNGPGPHLSERVTDFEWRSLCNAAIRRVWGLAAAARPDFQVAFQDFVVVSGGSASFALPSAFFDIIDVVFSPDTPSEYSLGVFAFANRRSPGGWWPANLGGTTTTGGSSVRLMGGNVFIEPSLRAGGTYRLWYCPKPKLIRADTTVRLATTAALPTVTATGAGVGKTLTEVGNGALTIDGTLAIALDLVLIQNQVNPVDNGIYTVTNAGSAGTQFVLTRAVAFDQVAEVPLGLMTYTSAGVANIDLFFELTSTVVTVDTTAQTWTEAFIDPILEHHVELVQILTAIPPMIRDDDLDPSALAKIAYGEGGADKGLVGDLKAYFSNVRNNNGPVKMVDTDLRGPRSPWANG